MNTIEHYKSLISDEEVIKALLKESKAREGDLLKEKTRVRPNLNFFQRTVTNLVTSNKRVRTTKYLVNEETEEQDCNIQGKNPGKMKTETTLSRKINFVSATIEDDLNEQFSSSVKRTKQSSDCSDTDSCAEKSYKEDLSKYFVPACEDSTNNKRSTQKCISPLSKSAKAKSIVFNLNFNKDRLTKPSTVTENISRNHTPNVEVTKSCRDDVISISSSSSSESSPSSESIIQISESDS